MKTVYFLLLFLILSGCDSANLNSEARPFNVPDSAMWVGGLDGGVYASIEKTKTDPVKIYNAIIYDSAGGVEYKGKLIINLINDEFNFTNEGIYSAWDGDTLYLKDGRRLTIYKAKD